MLELFWKHQRLQLGELLVRTRRSIPCPYTHHFNYRPNKTCRSKKAKIVGLIKLYKLWTKADPQCFCPCQGKGAYLAWGKRIWGEWGGGEGWTDGALPWQQRKEIAAQPPKKCNTANGNQSGIKNSVKHSWKLQTIRH